MYDIIGDIHGYADELELLLARLNYQRIDGVWQHETRTLVSVGDLVDRGPQQKRTVDIIRAMADKGFARVIMGNHEFNAVAYATLGSDGLPLRAHTDKNRKQHEAFLIEAEASPAWYAETISWFMTLPVLLDLQDFRVIHACWHPESVEIMKQYCDDRYQLNSTCWEEANDSETDLFNALEILMKGWELPLPEGYHFFDKDGHRRDNIRSRWWLEEHGHYRDMAIGVPDLNALPDAQVPAEQLPGYDNQKPLFIGHYWLDGKPSSLSDKVICVDYSVANKGALVAYRLDEGSISDDNFISVSSRREGHFSVEDLSMAFYFADPMHTCCVENECTDEYLRIAEHAKSLLETNVALFDAIKDVLVYSFDEGIVGDYHVVAVLKQLAVRTGK